MIQLHNFQYDLQLEELFSSEQFPWYYTPFTSAVNEDVPEGEIICNDNHTLDVPQLNHVLYSNEKIQSSYFSFVTPIIESFGYKREQLYRSKINLLYKNSLYPDNFYNIAHIDKEEGYVSILYYVNDSDGDTYFFDNSMKVICKTSPIKNNLVIFDSNILHASTPPRKTETRMVINFVLRKT